MQQRVPMRMHDGAKPAATKPAASLASAAVTTTTQSATHTAATHVSLRVHNHLQRSLYAPDRELGVPKRCRA